MPSQTPSWQSIAIHSQTSSQQLLPTHSQTSQIIGQLFTLMPGWISSCLPPALHSSGLPILYSALTCSHIFWCQLPFLASDLVTSLQNGLTFIADLQSNPACVADLQIVAPRPSSCLVCLPPICPDVRHIWSGSVSLYFRHILCTVLVEVDRILNSNTPQMLQVSALSP